MGSCNDKPRELAIETATWACFQNVWSGKMAEYYISNNHLVCERMEVVQWQKMKSKQCSKEWVTLMMLSGNS